ncbi:MAG: TIGR00266 family protein [Chloroflexi bacterium]|nr:TIGR00266 family protein [Chloroflexota bacterium]
MQIEINYRPSYSLATVRLAPGESIRAEGGAMVSMSSTIQMETKAQGGLFGALKRATVGGESFFMNTFRATGAGGEINLAPSLPGDVRAVEMDRETWMLHSGGFVASSEGIEVDTKWTGAKTFFAGDGPIMLRVSGSGTLLMASYGALHDIEVPAGQTYTVDTGHLVAFHEGMGFNIKRVGGLKSTLFSGEGLVVELRGPGKAMLQTRSEEAFLSWLIPHLPKRSGGD